LRRLAAVAMTVALSSSVAAQWSKYPTPGVPRTSDGKPDLSAHAPRTDDGKPDLSGIWKVDRQLAVRDARPPDPPPGTPSLATFWNLGAGFKEDLPFQPWAAELRKTRKASHRKDNPGALCLPMGFMQFHMHPPASQDYSDAHVDCDYQ
jgi:hypothetical protein